MKRTYFLTLFVLLGLLNACTTPPLIAPTPAGIAITSHDDGEIITGSREITVVAALSNADANAELTAQHNGATATTTRTGDTATVAVTLADNDNTITITVANPNQEAAATATVTVNYPFANFSTGQAAAVVIGQPDFVTTSETADDKFFDGVYGRPLVANGILYLPDYGVDRILGYLEVPSDNDAAADFVLGRTGFSAPSGPASSSTLRGPQTVATDGVHLYVAEYDSNRILVFDDLPTTSGASANHVIGQANFNDTGSACSATRFEDVESLVVVNGMLVVADGGNNRVLIWNTVPTAVDTPADLVLGQNSMITCNGNDDDQDGISDPQPSDRTLNWPTDVWSDGERLVVADTENHRILIWNTFPTSSFTPADLVLGQSGFTGDVSGSGAVGLSEPYMLHSNGNQLFVADVQNNRVLVWNEFPSVNGQAADIVLGQTDMNGTDGYTTASTLDAPSGVLIHGDQLFVADRRNDRYLVYQAGTP